MNKKVLLIGEHCVDQYVECEHTRQSPEDRNVPVYKIKNIKSEPGMSWKVKKALEDLSLSCDYFYTQQDEIIKKRIIVNNKQVCRIDRDEVNFYEGTNDFKNILSDYETLVISDYGKGQLSKDYIDIINNSKKRIYLDPHPNNPIEQYKNLYCIKLNQNELQHFLNTTNLQYGAYTLIGITGASHVFITLGKDGMFYMGKDSTSYHVESQVKYVNKVAGAGDIVMASLVKDLENNTDIKTSMSDAMKLVAEYIEQK